MNTNKYYVVKLLTNTQEQDASSVSVFEAETDKEAKTNASTHYHQILAAYHSASDVLWAVVEILNFEGTVIAVEIVDHRPEPEPTPEPEPEPTPEPEPEPTPEPEE